jgi:hypothetical protein
MPSARAPPMHVVAHLEPQRAVVDPEPDLRVRRASETTAEELVALITGLR